MEIKNFGSGRGGGAPIDYTDGAQGREGEEGEQNQSVEYRRFDYSSGDDGGGP